MLLMLHTHIHIGRTHTRRTVRTQHWACNNIIQTIPLSLAFHWHAHLSHPKYFFVYHSLIMNYFIERT